MNIRRQNKSNLVGRIRKLLVKEVMFLYMGGVSGYMTGTNPTQGHFAWGKLTLQGLLQTPPAWSRPPV